MTLQPVRMPSAFSSEIRIERLVTMTVDGEVVNDFQTVACVGAEIKSRASLTIKQADRITEGATHLVTIHYRRDVKGSSRLVLLPSGRVFEIRGKPRGIDEPNPKYLEIDCMETE